MTLRSSPPLAALISSLALGACEPGGASPIPQPTVLEVDDLTVNVDIPDAGHAFPTIDGRPGSVPAGATIQITALDGAAAPSTGTAASDGSFEAEFAANIGDELRIEWLRDGDRSPPLDVILGQSGADVVLVASPRFECLTLSPGFVLSFATVQTRTLSFASSCTEPATLDNTRTRLGSTHFRVASAPPIEVPPAGSNGLDVTFTPLAGDEAEDVLFVDVTTSGETIRYPITLIP